MRSLFAQEEYHASVAPAQWDNKGEDLRMPQEHVAYFAKLDYKAKKISIPASRRTTTTRC